jgi:hypothetical protein
MNGKKTVYILTCIWNGFSTVTPFYEMEYDEYERAQMEFMTKVVDEFQVFETEGQRDKYFGGEYEMDFLIRLFSQNKVWAVVNEDSIYEMVPATVYV